MQTIYKTFLVVFFGSLLLQSQPAESDPAQSNKTEKPSKTSSQNPVEQKKEDQVKASSAPTTKKQTNQTRRNNREFIDRDGDGIHDGQEHRFRGRHRRRFRNNRHDMQDGQRKLQRRGGPKDRR